MQNSMATHAAPMIHGTTIRRGLIFIQRVPGPPQFWKHGLSWHSCSVLTHSRYNCHFHRNLAAWREQSVFDWPGLQQPPGGPSERLLWPLTVFTRIPKQIVYARVIPISWMIFRRRRASNAIKNSNILACRHEAHTKRENWERTDSARANKAR
jgi:hypothetical protein